MKTKQVLKKICKNFVRKCLIQDTVSGADKENGINERLKVTYNYIWQFDESSDGYKEFIKEYIEDRSMDNSWEDSKVSFLIEGRSNGEIHYIESSIDHCNSPSQ